jgi:hypothetical protein
MTLITILTRTEPNPKTAHELRGALVNERERLSCGTMTRDWKIWVIHTLEAPDDIGEVTSRERDHP